MAVSIKNKEHHHLCFSGHYEGRTLLSLTTIATMISNLTHCSKSNENSTFPPVFVGLSTFKQVQIIVMKKSSNVLGRKVNNQSSNFQENSSE